MSVWISDEKLLIFASLISPSKMILFAKKYQAWDAVFHHQMKHLEVRQKYSAARRIFNSLLGVSSGDETLRLMLDILLQFIILDVIRKPNPITADDSSLSWGTFIRRKLMMNSPFLALGTLPYIGNFVHIGGFLFGLFASLALLPRTNYRCRNLAVNSCVKAIFTTLLLMLLVGMCVAFFLVKNPRTFCSWCHYVDCVPYKKDHFCPSMNSDGFLDNGTWRQVTKMFRVVANCTSVGIRLRAVSLPRFSERSARMRECRAANPRNEKKGRLSSSISCVVIFVCRAFLSTV